MKFSATVLIFSIFIRSIYGASVTDLPPPDSKSELPAAVPWPWPTRKTSTTSTTTEFTTSSSTTTLAPNPPTTTSTTTTTTTTSTSTSTTTAPPTSSTKSTTTTNAPTTTAPPPSPPPSKPETGEWSFTENNQTCILVRFAAQLNINYTTVDEKKQNITYNIPKDGKIVSGTCGNGTNDQKIEISWAYENMNQTISMTFALNDTTHEYSLNEIELMLNKGMLPNSTDKTINFYHVGNTFDTLKSRSYHCTRVQNLNLTANPPSKNVNVSISLSDTQIEAFRKTNNKEFSSAIDCDAISTPDIVPIAVGIALIALVVIVLIAYLVGRRRTRAPGYVSM